MKDQEDVVDLWLKGARIYACGSGDFVKEVSHAAKEIVRERRMKRGKVLSEGELESLFEEQMAGRTATDVFG